MDINMTADEVMLAIQLLRSNGMNMNKKKVKQSHPDFMRNTLHYFPDWNSAVEKAN